MVKTSWRLGRPRGWGEQRLKEMQNKTLDKRKAEVWTGRGEQDCYRTGNACFNYND